MTSLRVGPLVRATTSTSVVIWVEVSSPSQIIVTALPDQDNTATPITATTHTVTVGERHYAAPQLTGLQPATSYTYQITTSAEQHKVTPTSTTTSLLYCFRTLPSNDASSDQSDLRIAYGSCRKYPDPRHDALSGLGRWLQAHKHEQETLWPHLLLLIGDQIYADDPDETLLRLHPELEHGAQKFEDFACMYEYAWTNDEDVRQALAALPTFMIFDDHEVTNNWNITANWRPAMLKQGKEQLLIDGLVAYWIYQGWGNIDSQQHPSHPLLEIMQKACQSGEDILEALRSYIRAYLHGEKSLDWTYTIPTTPPIFVADVRADRPANSSAHPSFTTPSRIMSTSQMTELQTWLTQNDTMPSLIVSSVPFLLPPVIGCAEYYMGIRPFSNRLKPIGNMLARLQYSLALRTSFDHWPVFSATWKEMIALLKEQRRHDVLFLSGDVHFSYAVKARLKKGFLRSARPSLYQLVSTPLNNELNPKDRKLIMRQAFVKKISYGGLRTHILPLLSTKQPQHIHQDLLMYNTVAFVHISSQSGTCEGKQIYMSMHEGKLEEIAYTEIGAIE